jgi:hypothetical protein
LIVNEDLLKGMYQTAGGREEAKKQKENAALQTAAKTVTRNAEESEAAEKVLTLARANEKWDGSTQEELKKAFRGMGGDREKAKLKKVDFMPHMIALVAARIAQPAPAPGQGGQDAESEPQQSEPSSPARSSMDEDDD